MLLRTSIGYINTTNRVPNAPKTHRKTGMVALRGRQGSDYKVSGDEGAMYKGQPSEIILNR